MIKIGWLNTQSLAAIIVPHPEPLVVKIDQGQRSPLVRCPAVVDATRSMWLLRSPFSFEVRLDCGEKFEVKVPCDRGPTIMKQPRHEWRSPTRPITQVLLPFAFASDVPGVVVTSLPPLFDHQQTAYQWPVTVVPGQLNIYDWPYRQINFAVEWFDVTRPLVIREGDPLLTLLFQTPNGERTKIIEAEKTAAVDEVIRQIGKIAEYTTNTRRFFPIMQKKRPRVLVVPKGGAHGLG